MELGELVAVVKLNTEQFTTAHGVVSSRLSQMDRDAVKASAGFAALESRLSSVGGQLQSVGMGLTATLTAPLVGVGIAALKVSADMEQAKVAFTSFLGSAQKATVFLEELRDFAAKTPFELPGLISAAQRLMAMGIEAQKVIPTMRAIGDAVSAVGGSAETINRVVMAIGQIQAKSKLSAEEMLQLAEAGIPAWEMVARKIGVDVPAAMKMAEKGAISARVAIDALTEGMTAKYGGMMALQAKTLTGLFSTFKDLITKTLDDIGQSLMGIAKTILAQGTVVLEWVSSLATAFGQLPPVVQGSIIAIAGVAAAIGPCLIALGLLTSSVGSMIGLWAKLAPILGSGAGGMAASLTALGSSVATVLVPALVAAAAAMAAFQTAAEAWHLAEVLGSVAAASVVFQAWSNMLDSLKKKLVDEAPTWLREFGSAAQSVASLVWQKLSGISWTDIGMPIKLAIRNVAESVEDLSTGTDKAMREMNASIQRNLVSGTMSAADKIKAQVIAAVAAMATSTQTLTGALTTLGLKSTATLKAEYDAAKKAYDLVKSSAEGWKVKQDALDKVKKSAEALYGSVNALEEAFKKLGGQSYESTLKGFNEALKAYERISALARAGKADVRDVAIAYQELGEAAKKANEATKGVYENSIALSKAMAPERMREAMELIILLADEAGIHFDNLNEDLEKATAKTREWLRLDALKAPVQIWKDYAETIKSSLNTVVDAFKELDPFDTKLLQEKLEAYTQVYNAMASNAKASMLQISQAAVNMWESEIALARASGEEIDAEWVGIVEGIQKGIDQAMGKGKQVAKDTVVVIKELQQDIKDLASSMADAFTDLLFEGGSVASKLANLFGDLAKSITKTLVQGAFNDLLHSLRLMNDTTYESSASFLKFIKLFDSGAKTLSEAPKHVQAVTEALGKAPTAITTPTGTSGGAGGAATGLLGALSNLSGVVTMVAAVIDAIMEVLQYLQLRRMEKDIGRIEVTTRGLLNEALNNRADQWSQHWDIMKKLDQFRDEVKILSGIHVQKWNAFLSKYLGSSMAEVDYTKLYDETTQQLVNAANNTAKAATDTATAATDIAQSTTAISNAVYDTSYAVQSVADSNSSVATAINDQTDTLSSVQKSVENNSGAMQVVASAVTDVARKVYAPSGAYPTSLESISRLASERTTPVLPGSAMPVRAIDITTNPSLWDWMPAGQTSTPTTQQSTRPWPDRISINITGNNSRDEEFGRYITGRVLREIGYQGALA